VTDLRFFEARIAAFATTNRLEPPKRGEAPAHQCDSTLSHRAISSHLSVRDLMTASQQLAKRAYDSENRTAASGAASSQLSE
jgi:hypothetical protein